LQLVRNVDVPDTLTVRTPRGGRHLYFKGELRSTTDKLGAKIDTRGIGGYVLLPPSHTSSAVNPANADGDYTIENDDLDPVPLLDWIAPLIAPKEVADARLSSEHRVTLDLPVNILAARQFIRDKIKHQGKPVDGQHSDDRTYPLACELLDLALSPEMAVTILHEEWAPHFDIAWLAAKVASACKSRQNKGTPDATLPAAQTFDPATLDKLAKIAAQPEDNEQEPLELFGDVSIMPEPELMPGMLPKVIADFASDEAERLGVNMAMVALPALAACASALHDGIKIQPRINDTRWQESARLWVAAVAPPGGKKTPAIRAATAPLREIEARWQREDGVALAKYEDAQECHKAAFKGRLETIKDLGADLAGNSPRSDVPPPPVKPAKRRLTVGDTTMEGLAHVLSLPG